MTTIRGYVERRIKEIVGFKCSLCKNSFRIRYDVKEYKTEFDRVEDVSKWPVTNRAWLNYDHPDGEGWDADFCSDCFHKIRDMLKALGAKFDS